MSHLVNINELVGLSFFPVPPYPLGPRAQLISPVLVRNMVALLSSRQGGRIIFPPQPEGEYFKAVGESKQHQHYPKPFFPHVQKGGGSQSVVSGAAASVSPGSLLEIQDLGPHPKPSESETLEVGFSNLCVNKPST